MGIYLVVVLYCYSWIRDAQGRSWVRLQEIIRIPGIYYLFFFAIYAWLWALIAIDAKCCTKSEDSSKSTDISLRTQIVAIVGNVGFYALFILVSFLFQFYDVTSLDFTIMMIVLVLLYTIGVAVTMMLLKPVFGMLTLQTPSSQTNLNRVASVIDDEVSVP